MIGERRKKEEERRKVAKEVVEERRAELVLSAVMNPLQQSLEFHPRLEVQNFHDFSSPMHSYLLTLQTLEEWMTDAGVVPEEILEDVVERIGSQVNF